jgi:hypothetical protein
LKVGCWYRIEVPGGGRIEGWLRSTKIPQGFRLNKDGDHSIWVAGDDVEWFLRPCEIRAAQEVPVTPLQETANAG